MDLSTFKLKKELYVTKVYHDYFAVCGLFSDNKVSVTDIVEISAPDIKYKLANIDN